MFMLYSAVNPSKSNLPGAAEEIVLCRPHHDLPTFCFHVGKITLLITFGLTGLRKVNLTDVFWNMQLQLSTKHTAEQQNEFMITSALLVLRCHCLRISKYCSKTSVPPNLWLSLEWAGNPLISRQVTTGSCVSLCVCISPPHVYLCMRVWAECMCVRAKKNTTANHIVQQDANTYWLRWNSRHFLQGHGAKWKHLLLFTIIPVNMLICSLTSCMQLSE